MKQKPTVEEVRTLLTYDPESGDFVWKPRPVQTQSDKTWNTRFAGTIAGAIQSHGYRIISIRGVRYHAHRLAWLYIHGEWPAGAIDHANGVTGDNRLVNLRRASMSQNIANARRRSNNTSGIKGVHFCQQRKKWVAQIAKNGRHLYLGRFSTAAEAKAAYASAATHIFGDFARLS